MRRRPAVRLAVRLAALLATLTLGACESLLTRDAPYGTVRVQASSRSGVPLPGIAVQLYTGRRPMGYATTDASGQAVFRLIPPGEYGLLLSLPESEYADLSELQGGPPRNFRDGIAIDAGFDTTFSFVFARRGLGAIEALLRDSSGVPLEGVRVDFYRSSGVIGARFSNASGLARIDSVPTGVYGALVAPTASLGVIGAAVQFRDGLIVDRDIVPRAVFTLASCFGSITAQVRDQFDAPIVGIEVLRYGADGSERRNATGAGGSVTFGREPCGEYGLALQPLAGFSVPFVRDSGFVDGLVVTNGATVSATLRATRN